MFHNFLISYNVSQCNPSGALEHRPCGKGGRAVSGEGLGLGLGLAGKAEQAEPGSPGPGSGL